MEDSFVRSLVKKDLEKYGQNNPCPKSLTITDGRMWRHYELGSIYGFVVYNQMLQDGEEWFGIAAIEEDDEYWFVPQSGMNMAAFWASAVRTTYNRMADWITSHIFEGWDKGKAMEERAYVRRILKPIENEVIMFDGEPDNAVLGKKWINNQVQ